MRSTLFALLVVVSLLVPGTPSRAQTAPATAPQADSAQKARAAYRRAVAAYRERDIPAARTAMNQAAEWWPMQQVYVENAAGLAALARDTTAVIAWINRLADLGVGPDLIRDTSYRAFVGVPAFDAAARRLAAAVAAMPRSSVRLSVADSMMHPEGAAYDATTGRWFIGSVRQRRILVADRTGRTRDFVAPAADGIGGVFGMVVDAERRTLWVATTSLPRMERFTASDSGRVGVYGYDLDSGRLKKRAWAPRDSSVDHTFGDVAVAPNGDLYASDSQSPWLHVLRAGADSLVRFATHPLFRSLQGMAITPDGRTMLVADYSHGLLRVDLDSRLVTPLAVAGGVTTLGIDGLYLRGNALIGVQNGISPMRGARFCLDDAAREVRRVEVLDRNPALADEPTLGAIVGDSLFYVATSQWEKFDDHGTRAPNARLRAASLLGLSLDSANACKENRP
jgi:sugar lactone lactonase YvrE